MISEDNYNNISLWDIGGFKYSFIGIIAVSFFLCLPIWSNGNYKCDFSSEGYNNFIEIFKLPIAILALLIPLTALFSTMHRSKQTQKQIKNTNTQLDFTQTQIENTKAQLELIQQQIEMNNRVNNFTNYFKHAEEFKRYCEYNKIEKDIVSIKVLYDKYFPESRNGDYSPNNTIINSLLIKYAWDLKYLSNCSKTQEIANIIEQLHCELKEQLNLNSNANNSIDKLNELQDIPNIFRIIIDFKLNTTETDYAKANRKLLKKIRFILLELKNNSSIPFSLYNKKKSVGLDNKQIGFLKKLVKDFEENLNLDFENPK